PLNLHPLLSFPTRRSSDLYREPGILPVPDFTIDKITYWCYPLNGFPFFIKRFSAFFYPFRQFSEFFFHAILNPAEAHQIPQLERSFFPVESPDKRPVDISVIRSCFWHI